MTTRQLLSARDDVALASHSHAQQLNETPERGLNISADAAARRTAEVGPAAAPTSPPAPAPRACWGGSRPPPAIPTPARPAHPADARLSHFIGGDRSCTAVGTGFPFVRQLPRRAGLRPCSVRATPP